MSNATIIDGKAIAARLRADVAAQVKTLSQLQNQEMDTINPYGFSGVTSVHGFMSANISIKPVIRIGRQFNPRVNASCLWYDTIDVTLEIEPKIVIAK